MALGCLAHGVHRCFAARMPATLQKSLCTGATMQGPHGAPTATAHRVRKLPLTAKPSGMEPAGEGTGTAQAQRALLSLLR